MAEKYEVKRGKIETKDEDIIRYFILENKVPLFIVNEWLMLKAAYSINTNRQYAYMLCKFLNFLNSREKNYLNANKKDVLSYLHYLMFTGEHHTVKIESDISYSTISRHVSLITEFYRWLEDEENVEMQLHRGKQTLFANRKFLYGQIYSFDYESILNRNIRRLKGTKEYIKWYTPQEIEMLLHHFISKRDKLIFRLTLEGLRIDEALSISLSDYQQNRYQNIIRPQRSKGKRIGEGRPVIITEELCQEIDTYIWSERTQAETESGVLNDSLFINLLPGKKQGKEVTYANFRQILKLCAMRAGLDEKKIRTHSGRSTKTMSLLQYQAEHPEMNLTDEMVRQIMGWTNPNSINPYKNHHDIRLAKLAAQKINKKNGEEKNE